MTDAPSEAWPIGAPDREDLPRFEPARRFRPACHATHGAQRVPDR